jgi:hypothetical protein
VNHLTEEQLVAYHFGDVGRGDDAAAVEQHLHSCASCQVELGELRHVLAAVDSLPVPHRSDGYGAEVWARIQPSLGRDGDTRRGPLSAFLSPWRLALAGSVAVLMVAAFVAGRYVPRQPVGTVPQQAAQTAAPAATSADQPAAQPATLDREVVRERILLVAVGDHLERSQVALIELVNSPSGATVDISGEQQRARDLVKENRLYRQTALTTGDPAVASVLDELERVLVEIANSPSTMTAAEFSKVRSRIEQQGIIFKVNVFGQRVRERETSSVVNAG